MNDDELLKLARLAGWNAVFPEIREKLIRFGRLVVKEKNKKHRSQTDSGTKKEGNK